MENYLSNILPQITVLHADVSNGLPAYTINLVKMCACGGILQKGGKVIALTHVGLESLGLAWFPRSNPTKIEQRYSKLKHVSQFQMCEATECFGSARGSWPWALGCLNLKFTVQSTPGDGAGESLMPCTMRPFHSRSRESLAGVEGERKGILTGLWRIYLKCLAVLRRFACSSKKSYEGKHWRANRHEFIQLLLQPRLSTSSAFAPTSIEADQPYTDKMAGELFFHASELSVWSGTSLVTACHIARANHTDSAVTRCAQPFVWKHGTGTEALNVGEHQRTWFRLTRKFSAWFFAVTGCGSSQSVQVGNNSGEICFEHFNKINIIEPNA